MHFNKKIKIGKNFTDANRKYTIVVVFVGSDINHTQHDIE